MRAALKRVYFALSGDAPLNCWIPEGPRDAEFLPLLPDPPDGPLSFLSDAELDAAAASLERTGMVGAFNRYRAAPIDATESPTSWARPSSQPSCFIAGSRDPVRAFIPGSDGYADPGLGMHRLPRQHDHRGRRPLGASRAPGRGERRAHRVPRVAEVASQHDRVERPI